MSKESLEEKLTRERTEELGQLPKIEKSSIKPIEDMLRDKSVAKESDFRDEVKKADGVSAGYNATEIETGETFILKKFYKTMEDLSFDFMGKVRKKQKPKLLMIETTVLGNLLEPLCTKLFYMIASLRNS